MAKTILLCDDSAFMRQMLKSILSKHGYTDFYEAKDGVDVVDKYEQHTPDLVLLDITMPNRNGLDALRAIFEKDQNANVIMCSAMGQEFMVLDAMRSGAKTFVVKPFKEETVLKAVDSVLGGP